MKKNIRKFFNRAANMLLTASIGAALLSILPPAIIQVSGVMNMGETYVQPILKDSIKGIGALNKIITGNTRKNDIDENIQKIITTNPEVFFSNYNELTSKTKKELQVRVNIIDWENWGPNTFIQWLNNDPNVDIIEANPIIEKLDLISKEQFWSLINISINDLLPANYQNPIIPKVDFGIDSSSNLLIALEYSNVNKGNNNIKKILKIPQRYINFCPKINISFIDDQNINFINKEVTFNYNMSKAQTTDKKISFSNEASFKNNIVLKEQHIDGDNYMGLWNVVNDKDILEELEWLNYGTFWEETHLNGNFIDSKFLNIKNISRDLLIDENEQIYGLYIEMQNRNPNSELFNGEYKMFLETSVNNISEDYDLNLATNRYEIGIVNKNNTSQKLQLNVPNAYVLDLENNITIPKEKISKATILKSDTNMSLGLGSKNITDRDATKIITSNFGVINSKPFNEFSKMVKEVGKNKKWFNGVDIEYGNEVIKSDVKDENIDQSQQENYYMNYYNIKLKLKPKQGYVFKKNFLIIDSNNMIYSYNKPIANQDDINSKIDFVVTTTYSNSWKHKVVLTQNSAFNSGECNFPTTGN